MFDGAGGSASENLVGPITDQFVFNDYSSNETFAGCGSEAVLTSFVTAQIYADIPHNLNDNTNDIANATIGVTPSYILIIGGGPCRFAPLVLPFWLIPQHFNYGGNFFKMLHNGTGYQPPGNLTGDSNYDIVFAITARNETQNVDVHWDTPYPSGLPSLPSQASCDPFNGHVNMTWAFGSAYQEGRLQLYINVTLT